VKSKQSPNPFLNELYTHLILGIKFGIVGALVGFIIHAIWGTLDTILYTILTGFCIGLFVGFFELLFTRPKILNLSYAIILILRSIMYFLISLVSVYSVLVIYLKINGFTTQVLSDPNKFELISNQYFLTNINVIYVFNFTIAATFIWQLKAFLSKGVLSNYLIGRYHKPRIENRIFMFLDLNNATTIAEQLGSKQYSSLLNDFFKDIDLAITKTNGTVFQYVGDEVVVLWKVKDGQQNNNCLNAFFIAEKRLRTNREYYLTKYQTFPTFKASLHTGEVTITEIGVSKKEIAYHGDTINTTSRICSICNETDKKLLVSAELLSLIPDVDNEFVVKSIGLTSLKGKKNIVGLLSVHEKVK